VTNGSETFLPPGAVARLRSGLQGALLAPRDPEYEDRRRVWNRTRWDPDNVLRANQDVRSGPA